MAKVAYVVSFAQHLAESGRVGVLLTIGHSETMGNAIADAGYADGVRCSGCAEYQSAEDE